MSQILCGCMRTFLRGTVLGKVSVSSSTFALEFIKDCYVVVNLSPAVQCNPRWHYAKRHIYGLTGLLGCLLRPHIRCVQYQDVLEQGFLRACLNLFLCFGKRAATSADSQRRRGGRCAAAPGSVRMRLLKCNTRIQF
jgi:hypothetical protein